LGKGIDVSVGAPVVIGSRNVLLGSAGDACSLGGSCSSTEDEMKGNRWFEVVCSTPKVMWPMTYVL